MIVNFIVDAGESGEAIQCGGVGVVRSWQDFSHQHDR